MNLLSQQNPTEFTGKRVIVRVDFNVPIADGHVDEAESFRIQAAISTIQFLKNAGAKVILISHIGRDGDTQQLVAEYLSSHHSNFGVTFVPDIIGKQSRHAVENLQNGQIILLENIRQNTGEEANDAEFAQALASFGDVFVNDAFAVSHRAHASVVSVPALLPSFAGFLLESEINHLDQALKPISPSVLIMAGIKFETKLPLIEKLLPVYDSVILGGGLLNTYLAQSGHPIGHSLLDEKADLQSIIGNPKIMIPDMVIVERDGKHVPVQIDQVTGVDVIVDVLLSEPMRHRLADAQTVVWNGPLGWYEKGYTQSTIDVVASLGAQTTSIVGGGDTVTVIRQQNLQDKITFLSTGGGAMLEYLEQGTLPGIEALT